MPGVLKVRHVGQGVTVWDILICINRYLDMKAGSEGRGQDFGIGSVIEDITLVANLNVILTCFWGSVRLYKIQLK